MEFCNKLSGQPELILRKRISQLFLLKKGDFMGLGIGAIKLLLELYNRKLLEDKTSVLDIGSQELHLTLLDFTSLIEAAGILDYDAAPFSDLEHYPGVPRLSAAPFYNLLGLSRYKSIDINEDYGAIPLDLNYPLEDTSLYNSFDVVTDFGGAEHVFNMPEVYRSIHRLCKPQGLIIAIQGLYGGNGYYSFDHSFFEGISMANRYSILFCSLLITPKTVSPEAVPAQTHLPLSIELLDTLDLGKVNRIEVSYVMQKTSEEDFKIPYQGVCMSEQERIAGYKLQFLPIPPSRSYVPIAIPDPSSSDSLHYD